MRLKNLMDIFGDCLKIVHTNKIYGNIEKTCICASEVNGVLGLYFLLYKNEVIYIGQSSSSSASSKGIKSRVESHYRKYQFNKFAYVNAKNLNIIYNWQIEKIEKLLINMYRPVFNRGGFTSDKINTEGEFRGEYYTFKKCFKILQKDPMYAKYISKTCGVKDRTDPYKRIDGFGLMSYYNYNYETDSMKRQRANNPWKLCQEYVKYGDYDVIRDYTKDMVIDPYYFTIFKKDHYLESIRPYIQKDGYVTAGEYAA